MKTLTRDKAIYEMSADNSPAIEIQPGEAVRVETEDCYSGNLKTEKDVFTKEMWPTVNPATGPIFVKSAEPGDLLAVSIEKIETRDYAVMCVEHGAGALAEYIEGVETSILPIRDGKVVLDGRLEIPTRPMIGVIGTAPKGDAILNGTPGEHGGNMDCKLINAGVTVWLPVNAPGALLAMGDIHAVMGDGEVCICGAEVAGAITCSARLWRGPLPTPAVETDDAIHFIGSALQLDECEKMVLGKAHRFLTAMLGLKANQAARLMSLVGDLCVCQVVDPLKTMRFTLPKNALAACGFTGSAADHLTAK